VSADWVPTVAQAAQARRPSANEALARIEIETTASL
jgi:hypothetical protein